MKDFAAAVLEKIGYKNATITPPVPPINLTSSTIANTAESAAISTAASKTALAAASKAESAALSAAASAVESKAALATLYDSKGDTEIKGKEDSERIKLLQKQID